VPATAFNPAHRIIDQTTETAVRDLGTPVREARANALDLFRQLQLPDVEHLPTDIRIRSPAASFSAP
jgi:peptide/nickel transport system ATP-binding protein